MSPPNRYHLRLFPAKIPDPEWVRDIDMDGFYCEMCGERRWYLLSFHVSRNPFEDRTFTEAFSTNKGKSVLGHDEFFANEEDYIYFEADTVCANCHLQIHEEERCFLTGIVDR